MASVGSTQLLSTQKSVVQFGRLSPDHPAEERDLHLLTLPRTFAMHERPKYSRCQILTATVIGDQHP